MTPEEFEENARLVTGDPAWSLINEKETEDVTADKLAQYTVYCARSIVQYK